MLEQRLSYLTIKDHAVALRVPVTGSLIEMIGTVLAFVAVADPSPVTVVEALDTVELLCAIVETAKAKWPRNEARILLRPGQRSFLQTVQSFLGPPSFSGNQQLVVFVHVQLSARRERMTVNSRRSQMSQSEYDARNVLRACYAPRGKDLKLAGVHRCHRGQCNRSYPKRC